MEEEKKKKSKKGSCPRRYISFNPGMKMWGSNDYNPRGKPMRKRYPLKSFGPLFQIEWSFCSKSSPTWRRTESIEGDDHYHSYYKGAVTIYGTITSSSLWITCLLFEISLDSISTSTRVPPTSDPTSLPSSISQQQDVVWTWFLVFWKEDTKIYLWRIVSASYINLV